jgi:nitroreductase
MLQDQPANLPSRRPDGRPIKPLLETLLERRATTHFTDEGVTDEYLDAILTCAAQAPSGYNLQPWRFIVVRDPQNRARLRKAAMDQEKVSEAPVVVIVLGMKESWREHFDEIFDEGVRRGVAKADEIDKTKRAALQFLGRQAMEVWVTRHAMIATTYLMLSAEAYGFATAPMEGFDPQAVRKEFEIPEEAEVVALLAIGRAKTPIKAYPGRLSIEKLVHRERFRAGSASAGRAKVEELSASQRR